MVVLLGCRHCGQARKWTKAADGSYVPAPLMGMPVTRYVCLQPGRGGADCEPLIEDAG